MKISSGIKKAPHFVLIFGSNKVGKTTFAANAPNSIIVGPEDGSRHIDVRRAEGIKTYSDVLKAIKWLKEEKHDFQSLGLDSLDWIEPLLWAHVSDREEKKNIEEFGYGKGYVYATEEWMTLINHIQDLRFNRNMNCIIIAHDQIKTVSDPLQSVPYDRHTLKLHAGASAKWREAVDAILFATFEDTIFKINSTDKKGKATDGERRVIHTVRHPAYDAGNRLGLPKTIPLSYEAFAQAADLGQPDSLENVNRDLKELSVELLKKDKVTAEKMIAAIVTAKDDVTKLISIRNHARVLCQ